MLANDLPLQQALPNPLPQESLIREEVIPLDEVLEVKPFFLEGSVDDFDPVNRALNLSKTLPRNFCGTYRAFKNEIDKRVLLKFSKVEPIGQIVLLAGEMTIDNKKTTFTGMLNAKSDQLELIPLIDERGLLELESGGSFISLQGTNLFTWKSSSLEDSGGRLELKKDCLDKSSEAFSIRSVWYFT